jgi:hypothetical protein
MGTHSAKLLGGDSPVAILVEKGEGLLELSDLLLSKLVCTHIEGYSSSAKRRHTRQ